MAIAFAGCTGLAVAHRKGKGTEISGMVVAMIVVMGLVPVEQVVTARGLVVSLSPTILVQPLGTAIVRSIEVREGQHVRAGEILARLDPTFAAADAAALVAQVSSLEAEVSRLQAEAEGKPFAPTNVEPNWSLQSAIYGHRKAQFDSRIDNYNRRLNRAVSSFDIPQRVIGSVVYNLPFGRCKSVGGNWNPVVNTMFGGWDLNGIVTLQKGVPVAIGTPAVNTGVSAKLDNPSVDRWFNTAVFQPAAHTIERLLYSHARRGITMSKCVLAPSETQARRTRSQVG